MPHQEENNPDYPDSGSSSRDAMFKPQQKPKIIRVLTVLAYVLSVSMAAILLSIYYIFMWEGEPHKGARLSEYYVDERGNVSGAMFSYRVSAEETVPFPVVEKSVWYAKTTSEAQENVTTVTVDTTTAAFNNATELDMSHQDTTQRQIDSATVRITVQSMENDENTTWPEQELNNIEETSKSKSIFMKKLMSDFQFRD